MSLVLAELQRLLLRRITRYLPLGVVGLMLVGLGIAFINTTADDFSDAAGDLVELQDGLAVIISGFALLFTFVIGASYVGADAKTGIIEQLLTWEPRRLVFVAARAISILLVSALIAVFLVATFSALWMAMVGLQGGELGAIDSQFWEAWFGIVGRTALVAALFGLIGLTTALLTNSAVGPIVAFFVWAFVVENLVGVFWSDAGVYLPLTNADGFINFQGVRQFGGFEEGFDFDNIHHGPLAALAIVTAYAVAAVVISAVAFQRRDID